MQWIVQPYCLSWFGYATPASGSHGTWVGLLWEQFSPATLLLGASDRAPQTCHTISLVWQRFQICSVSEQGFDFISPLSLCGAYQRHTQTPADTITQHLSKRMCFSFWRFNLSDRMCFVCVGTVMIHPECLFGSALKVIFTSSCLFVFYTQGVW